MTEEEIGKRVYDLAVEHGWVEKLLDVFKKKQKVLVLGSSGVGKSNLLKSLTNVMPEVIHHSDRTTSATSSIMSVNGLPFEFIDTPGQEGHAALRNETIREHLSSINLIINVVCYGYHEYARGADKAIGSDGSVRHEYLEANRARELSAVRQWSESLGGNAPYRLLTVVSKADLWWHQSEEVLDYYEKGEYFESLGALSQLNPIVVHHSSVFHKFYGRGKMSGSFDEQDRVRARASLLRSIVELVGQGGSNAS